MSAGGWILLGLSWGVILASTAFCLWRILRDPGGGDGADAG